MLPQFYSLIFSKRIVIFLAFLLMLSCSPEVIPIPSDLIEERIESSSTNDAYIIRIKLPSTYDDNPNRYPVLYQLDGNTTTVSVIESYTELVNQGLINEAIIVTIDYEATNARVRDFTPSSHHDFENSGGADAFLNFLRMELVPSIDQDFLTDGMNVLRGHSLGGLFASYALFQNTEAPTFSGFIIESPSWWWDDNYAIAQEDLYASKYADLNTHAYFAVGAYEPASMKGIFELMKLRLESRNYAGLNARFEILNGLNHLDVRKNAIGLIELLGK